MAKTNNLRGGLDLTAPEIVTVQTFEDGEDNGLARPAKPGRIDPRQINTLRDDDTTDRPSLSSADTATDLQAVTGTTTITTLPEPNPVEKAVTSAVRSRVRKLAIVSVLSVPVAFTVAAIFGFLPLMTILVAWSAALVLGGPLKSAIEVSVMKCLTLKLWVEVAATVFLIGATAATTGVVWQWCMAAAVAVCLIHRLVFSLQASQTKIAVIEETVEA